MNREEKVKEQLEYIMDLASRGYPVPFEYIRDQVIYTALTMSKDIDNIINRIQNMLDGFGGEK